MDQDITRRAFVIHVGAAAALLGGAVPSSAQTPPAPVAGKEKLIVRSPRPINLETPLRDLSAEITPTDLFFVRNNYDGPEIDASQYVLKVDGEVDNPLTLRLDDLRRMEQITHTITLECAGNGRSFYSPKAPGLQWENGAVGTAAWKGVRLAEVLRLARPRPSASHVVPDGNDAPPTAQAPDFIRSHPIWKAMEPHTMIAIEMNGRPLPHLHGGPARLIVPGWIGSASIKWLVQLTLADKEWGGPFMQRSYRSPRVEDPQQTYSLQSLECKSLIVSPLDGARVAPGAQMMRGYAWAGEGSVTGVDVSLDGGKAWAPAALSGPAHRYAWRGWEFPWTAVSGAHTFMARASDSLGRVQPGGKPRDPQGYRWNVIHAVRIDVA
ncbi:MAG TPA: sulfite oxidase [Candidatus Nitrosocosmicus sp.]|jgi:DMSO/TMAO reductase YedYZ molybdopterin-dependent catalytic subunit|nr:sulfite oxidase [Candidatus Nitrosocosmicus sp.]